MLRLTNLHLRCVHTRSDWGRPRVRCGLRVLHPGRCRVELGDGTVVTWTPGDWFARYTAGDSR